MKCYYPVNGANGKPSSSKKKMVLIDKPKRSPLDIHKRILSDKECPEMAWTVRTDYGKNGSLFLLYRYNIFGISTSRRI